MKANALLALRLRRAALIGALRRYGCSISRQDWILGRYACMGRDVLALKPPLVKTFNLQKARADYLSELLVNPSVRARSKAVAPHLLNSQILPFVLQQEYSGWMPSHPPVAIYMDSFAELTDQVFAHKREGWKFCAAWSDVSHTVEFEATFRSEGLLPVESLERNYRHLFETLRARYGNAPIFFLHFPSKLETREKFRLRKIMIEEVLEEIKDRFAPLHTLSIPEDRVAWPEERVPGLEAFPYHYNQETYRFFRRELDSIDAFRRVCGVAR